MNKSHPMRHGRRRFGCPVMIVGCFALWPMCGCLVLDGNDGTGGNGNGGSGNGGSATVTADILSILANASLSIDDPAITIFYRVTGQPDSIDAVFVPVADSSADAMETGERESLGENLPASGADAFFQFFPTAAGVGFFRVGILVTDGADVIEAFSDGVIQVQGGPAPCFTQPCGSTGVGETIAGCGALVCDRFRQVSADSADAVTISFDAGDPEGVVQWRLFYLRQTDARPGGATPADDLGVEILVGSGNLGLVSFVVSDLAPGDYELGLSATDSGRSVAGTFDLDGNNDRIVTVLGPVIRVVP